MPRGAGKLGICKFKAHLATALSVAIFHREKWIGYNTVNLVNQLDLEKKWANISNLAKEFRFFDADILDELSYLLFP